MRVTYATLMLVSVAIAQAAPPVTTTYEVISTVTQLRQTRRVVLATRDTENQLRLMDDINYYYFDPVGEYEPIVFDLVYDYSYSGHDDPYQFVYNGKTLLYSMYNNSIRWDKEDDSGNFYFDITIDAATHHAEIRPTGRPDILMTAAARTEIQLTLASKTELPVYLYSLSTKLTNAPQVKINGTDVEITADAGCDIMYQLIPQTDTAPLADADEWHLWNADEWPQIAKQYTGDVLLRVKSVYGDTESDTVEHLLKFGTVTSITDTLIPTVATYYDLYGHPVADITAAQPGIYIEIRGSESKKYIKSKK